MKERKKKRVQRSPTHPSGSTSAMSSVQATSWAWLACAAAVGAAAGTVAQKAFATPTSRSVDADLEAGAYNL